MKNKKINVILILVVTLIVLYFSLKDNYREIITVLLQADIRWLFLSFILTMGYSIFKSMIMNDIIQKYKNYGLKKVFHLQIMTFFFNAITPFSSGGQPFQVYVLKKNGIPIAKGTNVIVQETILHQCSMLLLSLLALTLNCCFLIVEMNAFLTYLFIISFLINTFVLAVLFVMAYAPKLDKMIIHGILKILNKIKVIKNKEKLFEKWNTSIESFHEGSKMLFSNKARFVKLITFNILGLLSLYVVPVTILFSFGNFTAFDGLISIVLTIFVSIMSSFVPLPGATGGQEYLFLLLFGTYIANPILGSLMILWRFITYYIPMIIGAIVFNLQKKRNGE